MARDLLNHRCLHLGILLHKFVEKLRPGDEDGTVLERRREESPFSPDETEQRAYRHVVKTERRDGITDDFCLILRGKHELRAVATADVEALVAAKPATEVSLLHAAAVM